MMCISCITGGKFHNITAGVCGGICCSESDVRCMPSSSCPGLLESSCTSQTKGTKFSNRMYMYVCHLRPEKFPDCCRVSHVKRILISTVFHFILLKIN